MALSNYQYTKGKHWYFKNAGKKRDGIISLFRILRYLFTYDACKDPNNRSDTETGTLSKMVALTQVVQEYERAVIFRLGRLLSGGSRGPGEIMILSRGPGEIIILSRGPGEI